MSSLPLLNQNLQELWNAVDTTPARSEEPLPIVASYSGVCLYDSRVGFGRMWTWFYSFVEMFCHRDIKGEKLRRAVIHTHRIFQDEIERLEPVVQRYQQHLRALSKGSKPAEEGYLYCKGIINEWNLATKQFVELVKVNSEPRTRRITHIGLRTLLGEILGREYEGEFTAPATQKLILCQEMIDLENNCDPANKRLIIHTFLQTHGLIPRQKHGKRA